MVQIILIKGRKTLFDEDMNFISHMVQIIPKPPKKNDDNDYVFISHMVQIIPNLKSNLPCYIHSLYPTWFR